MMKRSTTLCDFVVFLLTGVVMVAVLTLIANQSGADPSSYHTPIPADFDRDGDVDLRDYAEFQASFSGGIPFWVQDKIAWYEAAPPMNPPVKFYRYRYLDEIVFWRGGYCCDFPSALWDAYGNFICCPGGGISGTGDNRCPDFQDWATDEVLIWQDER